MPVEYYADYWWEDMPEKARKAAKALGYTAETWDNDGTIPYDGKTFFQCTEVEKHAAMYLGMNPIGSKLDIWWDDLDKKTQEQAQAVGWTKENWDDDWEIEHLPINEKYWADMSKKEQNAAKFFGYTKATWDETWEEEEFKKGSGFTPMTGATTKPTNKPNSNKPSCEPTKDSKETASAETKVENKEEDDSGFIDNLCSNPCAKVICAPYKILFAPAKMVAGKVLHKK